MFISRGCLNAILENLSELNKEMECLEQRIADLEEQVRGQQIVKVDVNEIQKNIQNYNSNKNRLAVRYCVTTPLTM